MALVAGRVHRVVAAALPVLVAAVLVGGGTGCAHRVLIQSDPPGARIYVDGHLEGESPVVVERRSSAGGRMRVTVELENFQTEERIVEADEWFAWPALIAVTPLIGIPFLVVPVAGPFISCGWALLTSPSLFALAFLRKYPDEVTVTLRPRFGGGVVLPTDSWMIPDDVDPNPPPLPPIEPAPEPAPATQPAAAAPSPPKPPPQPEGANPPPLTP